MSLLANSSVIGGDVDTGDTGDTGDIGHSLRFRGEQYISKTITTSATSTYSFFVKRGKLGVISPIVESSIKFNANDTLTAFGMTTTAVFRDPTSWVHVHISNGGLYVNGVSLGAVTTSSVVNGRIGYDGTNYFDGYLARVCVVDGASSSYSNFCYFNTEINEWVSTSQAQVKAIVDAGGTNSFMLDFDDGSSLTTLGYDKSSKGNNWTLNNFSLTAGPTYDWMLDVPGNSFATLNAVHAGRSTLTNGNLTASGATDLPTIIPDSGTWYFERGGVSQTWTPPAAFPSGSGDYNFGQRPFSYTPPTGFKALCQANLPEPAIKNPKKHFDVVTRSGTGASANITGKQFAPDFVWSKARNSARGHSFFDRVRGVTAQLCSNLTAAEATTSVELTSFNSDGFSVGASSGGSGLGFINVLNDTYVDWLWKAGGAPIANNAGSIQSQVSANVEAGFSIVTYTGTGANATVGHGLGKAPGLVICKPRSAVGSWPSYHSRLTSAAYYIDLQTPSEQLPSVTVWNSTAPTSSVVSLGSGGANLNATHVAYCFAEIPGYSKIGSYTGNGNADGPFVHCGFKPRFIMIKNASTAGGWYIFDTARDTYNVMTLEFAANSAQAENTYGTFVTIDVTSNGFKVRNTVAGHNGNGNTYIYYAIADVSGKYSLGR